MDRVQVINKMEEIYRKRKDPQYVRYITKKYHPEFINDIEDIVLGTPIGEQDKKQMDLTPAKKQEIELETQYRADLVNQAKQYKSLVDEYGFESDIAGPEIAGKMEGLRSDMLARIKKAETLGTLDKGLLDFADMLLGVKPTGPLAPFRNIGGSGSAKVSSQIGQFISNEEQKIQTNKSILGEPAEQEDLTFNSPQEVEKWLQENQNDPQYEIVKQSYEEKKKTMGATTQGKVMESQTPTITEEKEDSTDTKPMYQKVGETLGDFFGGKQIGEAIGNYVGAIIAKQSGKKDKENTIATIEKAYQEGTLTKEKRDQVLDQYEKEQREVYGYTGPGIKKLLADTAYIATNFIPYGKLAKEASLGAKSLVALRNVATAATSVGLKSVSEGESFTEGAKKGATGYAVITAATKPIAPLARFVGGVAKRVGSSFSGIGSEVLDEIIKNPKLAKEGMKMEATDAILKNAKESVSILADYEQRMRTEYAEAMKSLPQVNVDTPTVKTSILDKISSLLKDRKVNIGAEGLDFSKSRFADPGDEKRISAIFNEIQEIADATPQALNVTKQRIREFRKTSSPDNKIFNNFVDTAVGIVDKQINEFGPEIANINKKFSGKADIADAMRKELGSLESAKNISRADLIKVQKRISTLFTKGKEPVRELFRDLGAEDVIARQAGTEIRRVNEGQSSKISDAIMNVVRASGIPKVVGRSALSYGQVKSVVDKVISGREKELSSVERIVLSKILATFGEAE